MDNRISTSSEPMIVINNRNCLSLCIFDDMDENDTSGKNVVLRLWDNETNITLNLEEIR